MYVYYDDRSQIFETEAEAKEFLFNELARWDSDFFTDTLNEYFSAMDLLIMVVHNYKAEKICYECDCVVHSAASREVRDNFSQYFDEIDENEED